LQYFLSFKIFEQLALALKNFKPWGAAARPPLRLVRLCTCSPRPYVRTWGAKLVSCPWRHLTSVHHHRILSFTQSLVLTWA